MLERTTFRCVQFRVSARHNSWGPADTSTEAAPWLVSVTNWCTEHILNEVWNWDGTLHTCITVFNAEDADSMFLWNVAIYPEVHAELRPTGDERRHSSSRAAGHVSRTHKTTARRSASNILKDSKTESILILVSAVAPLVTMAPALATFTWEVSCQKYTQHPPPPPAVSQRWGTKRKKEPNNRPQHGRRAAAAAALLLQ
jgi:hypothetical protein